MPITVRLRATKRMKYGTRRMLPGDEFDAPKRDANILRATRKVTLVRAPAIIPPPPEPIAAKIAAATVPAPAPTQPSAAVQAARAEYTAVTGRNPFSGWSLGQIAEKTAAARAAKEKPAEPASPKPAAPKPAEPAPAKPVEPPDPKPAAKPEAE